MVAKESGLQAQNSILGYTIFRWVKDIYLAKQKNTFITFSTEQDLPFCFANTWGKF